MINRSVCPACTSPGMSPFFEARRMPIHCNVLLSTEDEARQYPRGDIILGFCQTCGFIYNLAFEPDLMKYSPEYENSQVFSPLFHSYLRSLASHLVDRYDLYAKDIIEIGCGKGDFLTMLCELGENRGVGFDPSYEMGRANGELPRQITFIRDFYSERYAGYRGDLVCCRHTLEHVQDPASLLATVRRSIGRQGQPVIFFEVPNVMHTLRELAIWDVIYEHCSYFSPESLARLFTSFGFEVVELTEAFQGQYLWVEAVPRNGSSESTFDEKEYIRVTDQDVACFAEGCRSKVETWRREIDRFQQRGQRCVVWGAGSKGATFLNLLNIQDSVGYVVDVNPHKQGMYVVGTGQRIVPPGFLQEYRPDVILAMNPVYRDEIQQLITSLGVRAEILLV